MDKDNLVGEKIRKIRIDLGLEQAQLAKMLNTTQGAISNWERGDNMPNKTRLKEIADLGNTTVSELLGENKNVGSRIKGIRERFGLTTEEFGNLFGATKGTVSKWENGKYLPNNQRLTKIADFAGITVQELLSDENPLSMYSTKELLQELMRREEVEG